jgi:alcohol dehydrogenase YqhD (iron-dependent ADH family)
MAQVAVPTTYAGSEVTPVLSETENGVKTTRRDPAIAPGTVVYDPELMLTMPAGLTLTSSLNALAHAVETLWTPDATAARGGPATEAAAPGLLGHTAGVRTERVVVGRGRSSVSEVSFVVVGLEEGRVSS